MKVEKRKLFPVIMTVLIALAISGCSSTTKDSKKNEPAPTIKKPVMKAEQPAPKQEDPMPPENEKNIDPQNINPNPGITSNVHLSWWIRRIPNAAPGIDPNFQKLMARYNGLYLGKTDHKRMALTFDVGDAGNENVPALLDVLRRNNVKATFFVTGQWVQRNPQTFKLIIADGHLIGNHSYNHPDLTTLSPEQVFDQINRTSQLIIDNGGKKPIFFRPPFGYFSETVLNKIYSMGYYTTFWGISMTDWKPMTQEQLVHGVVDYAHNGAIAIIHVTQDGARALDTTIPQLKAQGYELVTLEQLVS